MATGRSMQRYILTHSRGCKQINSDSSGFSAEGILTPVSAIAQCGGRRGRYAVCMAVTGLAEIDGDGPQPMEGASTPNFSQTQSACAGVKTSLGFPCTCAAPGSGMPAPSLIGRFSLGANFWFKCQKAKMPERTSGGRCEKFKCEAVQVRRPPPCLGQVGRQG